ncbi:hypothetical protein WHR41_09032 [Cladosporium halotolerans]|uniref:Zn(2)-C6 fungal-type domain-containing protein n=1 Tax=Cladosporium halotolerans TaxID=1052096 RepID=A0AB34KDI7_9PEZI
MEVPSHRACAVCRAQKVRCLPDESNPDACQRCARAGRACVFTPLQKRKQRKRTDTRVAELEREMRAMRALLKEKSEDDGSDGGIKPGAEKDTVREDAPGDTNNTSASQQSSSPDEVLQGYSQVFAAGKSALEQQNQGFSRQNPKAKVTASRERPREGEDVINRGVLSMQDARRLVEHYKTKLYPQCPQVYIPDTCSADDLRESRPTLFLAVIAAAAEIESPDLANILDQEVLQEYANRTVVRSEKSIELVQSLLVSAVWYVPPTKFGNLKYYEYISMAATMASDLGITTRPSTLNRSRFAARYGAPSPSLHPSEDISNPDLSMSIRVSHDVDGTGSVECRRTFLACYSICIGISLSLRRPAMMRVTKYTKECLEFLENSPQATHGDVYLVAWTRLWMIGEEISTALSYDDPGETASILDTSTQTMMTAFEKKLTEWRARVPDQHFAPSLKVMYYTIRMFLHELALHIDHSPEDFKAPYQMGAIHPCSEQDIPVKPVVHAVAELVQCSHALINTFVEMGTETVRCLPIFYFVRVSFAAFVLAKLCLSAASPHSRLADTIDRKTLQAEAHVDKLILFVQETIGSKGRPVPSIFLALLFKLRQWCSHPELIQQADAQGAPTDIWPEGIKKAQEQIAIDGPRIAEVLNSSTEPSPENVAGPDVTPAHWNTPSAWSGEPMTVGAGDATASLAVDQGSISTQQARSIQIPSTPTLNASQTLPQLENQASVSITGQQGSAFEACNLEPSIIDSSLSSNWTLQDPMELDGNMLAFLDNVDDFSQVGLTGLEDWETFQNHFGSVQGLDEWHGA